MDLKALREDKLKQSRSEFARRIGRSEEQVKQWEQTGNIGLEDIQNIVMQTGLDFNTVMGYKKPIVEILKPENTWKEVEFTQDNIEQRISDALNSPDILQEQKTAYIKELQDLIDEQLTKPKLAIVGRSDTGKSTLINTLLGSEKMPASWTPTTAIAVYIKHISNKPSFIKGNENVWVFADHLNTDSFWDVRRLNDEEYCRAWKIASGDVDILQRFGVRQEDDQFCGAGSAVVFVDAPILQNCDIIDLPGFGTEQESDNIITFKTAQKADIIIYLSQANGFMRIEDINYLKENIQSLPVWEKQGENRLPPLSNLFVVASQAHTVNNGNEIQLKEILKKGCERLEKTLPEHYWNKRQTVSGYSEEIYSKYALPNRFFTYTTDIPNLCQSFNNELKSLLETLPEVINDRVKRIVNSFVSKRKLSLQANISKYEEICEKRAKYVKLLTDIANGELERAEDNDSQKRTVKGEIETLQSESEEEFRSFYMTTVNTDFIVNLLKEKNVKNSKEDIDLFVSQFQSMIQKKAEAILEEKSYKLSEVTKKYVDGFSQDVNQIDPSNSICVDFDADWAFFSALRSLGIWGGLGTGIVGTAAALLMPTSLFAGTAGTVASVAGLALGPIGLAAGLAVGGAMGLARLFGGGWERNVAQKLVKSFEENHVQESFSSAISKYWKDAENAFDHAAQVLEENWVTYVENLRKAVNEYDDQQLAQILNSLKNVITFFDSIRL